ncbi:unnamed protein product [Allacma fusca]|uniref:Integrase core domain-containing protein n=1 Tax=Allacma fusca TaxID=39272 RepID=A0A8J2NMX3_9HEXA|nr:unnamed protein product [Allacma fusca]
MSMVNEVVSALLQCLELINGGQENYDRILIFIDSVLHVIDHADFQIPNRVQVNMLLESLFDHIMNSISGQNSFGRQGPGRPRLGIQVETIEHLLRTGFNVTTISKLLGVSRWTVYNRLGEQGLTASSKYSSITDDELYEVIRNVHQEFPNTGYKRMQGYLRSREIIIPQMRLREAVKFVDPEGVFQRTMRSRIIVRRQYFVKYSNEIWHLDTHMKLIRWKFIIRGAIDGKSRLVPYLEADNNNRSENNLKAFLKGVQKWSLPLRTRSDKGMENVLIARFMLETRGTNRGSHICGRSVHNQRIERYWGELFQGMLWFYYVMFSDMESQGILDINNNIHLTILHLVFIPRLNRQLQEFADGWNEHPLSTEHNWSPKQIFLVHLPRQDEDHFDQRNFEGWNYLVNVENDFQVFEEDVIRNPTNDAYILTTQQQVRMERINFLRPSECNGVDIYLEALSICLN